MTFYVGVVQHRFASHTFEIDAASEQEAREQADDQARNCSDWDTFEVEYETEYVEMAK